MRRKISAKLTLGLAAGVVALCGVNMPVQAQDSTTMSSTSTAPTPVTGSVVRYYVDRAGYVTAVDIQTASGVSMVRFSPSMAQRLTSMYPVGSTATVYASQWNGSWYLVGTGPTMPAPTAMYEPYTITALDVLKSEPYTIIGAKESVISGDLTGYVADKSGEVLAIVLDHNKLIRVPKESRQGNPAGIPEGVTPLFKGAKVEATVLPEAPRYGAVSPFESRWIGSAIAVNGQTLGAKGFGKVKRAKNDTLFNWNIGIFGGSSPEEVQANNWGYTTYAFPGSTAPATPNAP
jgi:hypothetical protein